MVKTPPAKPYCELCVECIQSCQKKAIDYKGVAEKGKQYLNPNVKL
ncbi:MULTISPECIES: hypothetical protein [unclassified Clostridium]|nr:MULTISPECIES: hypothetical protein [unclassified Clostridium]